IMSIRLFLIGLWIASTPFVFGQTNKDLPTQDESLQVAQRGLDLSDTQVTRVKRLVEARQVRLQTIHQQAKPAFEELVRLLKEPTHAREAIDKAAAAFTQIDERAISDQENTEREFLDLLNPEQLQTVHDLRSQDSTALALHRLGLLKPQRLSQKVIQQ